MIFLIVSGILMIVGITLYKLCDNDFEGLGATLGVVNAIIFFPLLVMALIANSPLLNNQTRIRLANERVAIVEELHQSDHDIMLQGIKDARNFNIELEQEQYKLSNWWVKIFHPYVYNEFTPIEYNE